ncbi:YbhB/YbcL family Raf kinase inhibitor-like protein [Persephonella sp.]|nr:YbhB/YbcL family Raf kinase inhibitor-like protein [Aquificota bacterium]
MIHIYSSAVEEGGVIPVRYTCDGEDVSPDIRWSGAPEEETLSYVLIMEDPDAPIGTFTHWTVYDIPASVKFLPENFPDYPQIDGIKQGINDFGRIGYGGPCPPPGKPHRYIFRIFAIDQPSLGLPAGASRQEIEMAMTGKVIDEGSLTVYYGR